MLQRVLVVFSLFAIAVSVGAYLWFAREQSDRIPGLSHQSNISNNGNSADPNNISINSSREVESSKPAMGAYDPEANTIPTLVGAHPSETTSPTQEPFAIPRLPNDGIYVPAANGASQLSPGGNLMFKASLAFVNDIKVPAHADGLLREFYVDDGSVVEADSILVEIDSDLALAEQEVATKQLQAAKIKADNDSQIQFAKASFEVAENAFKRAEELYRKQVTGIDEYDKARLEQKKAFYQINASTLEQEIAKAEVGVNMAKLEAAKVQLNLRTIKAPFRGVVHSTVKERWDWVKAGEEIMRLVSMDRFRVKGNVAITTSPNALINAPAKVTVHISKNESVTVDGKVGFVSPEQQGNLGYAIWVEIPNQFVSNYPVFRGGMDATVEILVKQ